MVITQQRKQNKNQERRHAQLALRGKFPTPETSLVFFIGGVFIIYTTDKLFLRLQSLTAAH